MVNAFKFINQHNAVYLRCKLIVCKAYDYSSRCYQGCLTRGKRDTGELQDKVDLVVGPVQLQKEAYEDKKQGNKSYDSFSCYGHELQIHSELLPKNVRLDRLDQTG